MTLLKNDGHIFTSLGTQKTKISLVKCQIKGSIQILYIIRGKTQENFFDYSKSDNLILHVSQGLHEKLKEPKLLKSLRKSYFTVSNFGERSLQSKSC